MEFSEYLLLTFTSSLTLSMAGIFKEIFTLYLAVNYNGDQMSQINFIGLLVCLFGISTHVCLKAFDSQSGNVSALMSARTNRVSRLAVEPHGNSRPSKSEEFESTRLLDEDVIHFDLMSTNNALSQPYGAKNV